MSLALGAEIIDRDHQLPKQQPGRGQQGGGIRMGFQVPGAGSLETAVPSRPVGVDHVFLQVHLLPAGRPAGGIAHCRGQGTQPPLKAQLGLCLKQVPYTGVNPSLHHPQAKGGVQHLDHGVLVIVAEAAAEGGDALSGHDPLDLKGHCLRLRLGEGGTGMEAAAGVAWENPRLNSCQGVPRRAGGKLCLI